MQKTDKLKHNLKAKNTHEIYRDIKNKKSIEFWIFKSN